MPLALRSRLTASIDELAVALALDDIAADGQPRCVNLSISSLQDSGFASRLRGILQSKPLLAYMDSLFNRDSFQESLTEQEREMRL